MVVIGVDIGTTSAKAVAFDQRGGEHGNGEVAYPLDAPEHGQAVQDPERVVDATVEALRIAAAEASAAGKEVAGLSFSSAMHSLVGLDERDRPLTPLVTWADLRASEQAERLRTEHFEVYRRTGTPLHPMAPLAKLVWFREREPETHAAVRRWAGIKDLALARLTGEWAIDHSCASGTGLLELGRLDWDAEALELAGIDAQRLSPLVPAKQTFALREAVGELRAGTPVVAGAGDGPLANLGVGAVHPGVAACSIGTSAALRLMVERPVVDGAGRLFCYALTPDRWVTGGAINNGGSVLGWVGEALAPDLGDHPEQELLALAAEVPAGSDGLVMLPYLLSERGPHWSALPRGAYVGLTRDHGRGHLVRAAIEGVCQQLALVLASLRDAGNEVSEVRATGGFARSELWRQMLSDALGMRVCFPATHEGSAFGAALLGMEALGAIESFAVAADLLPIEEACEPEPEAAAVYAELLPLFADLYDALGPAFRTLRRLTR
jgi:gluconokinase